MLPRHSGTPPKDFGKLSESFGKLPTNLGRLSQNFGKLPDNSGRLSQNFGELPRNFGELPKKFGKLPENRGRSSGLRGRSSRRADSAVPSAELTRWSAVFADCTGSPVPRCFSFNNFVIEWIYAPLLMELFLIRRVPRITSGYGDGGGGCRS